MLNKAYINLSTLKQNALKVKSKLPSSTRFCAVVKADAYGHGAPMIASAIYNIVDSYAVALVEEGEELRLSGIDKDILVTCPVYPFDLERLIRFDLTATVSSIEQVGLLENEAKRQGKKVKVHVKYNTGMNRQGVDGIENLKNVLDKIKASKNVVLDGMYSHFSRPENNEIRKRAENKFLLANNLIKIYNNKAKCHISASGGFLKGAFYDMVRIGILLYGYKPFCSDFKVDPIMKVYAPVITKRDIEKGESALYGKCPANENQSLSLVRFGYADGLPRKAVLGQFNNRCMDLTAITGREEKSEIVIMDDAEKLAKEYGTISYEILTSVCKRAEKIYVDEENK